MNVIKVAQPETISTQVNLDYAVDYSKASWLLVEVCHRSPFLDKINFTV